MEWLLEAHPQLLNSEVTGDFFAPAGNCYFGGYPLLFAVATKQPQVVRKILGTKGDGGQRRASLAQTDRHGNTCLHLAVVHDCPETYDFIWGLVQSEGATKGLQHAANNERLTPLALAVAMGHTRMFQQVAPPRLRPTGVVRGARSFLRLFGSAGLRTRPQSHGPRLVPQWPSPTRPIFIRPPRSLSRSYV